MFQVHMLICTIRYNNVVMMKRVTKISYLCPVEPGPVNDVKPGPANDVAPGDANAVDPDGDDVDVIDAVIASDMIPLPNSEGLSTENIIHLLQNPVNILQQIPSGKKENTYCVVNNQANIERRKKGRRGEYNDDCGAWCETNSSNFPYEVMDNGSYRRLFWKAATKQYCFDKKIGKKHELVPFDPQPSPDDIIWLQRYYLTLVASNTFKKNVFFLVSQTIPGDVAVVQYTGHRSAPQPCGNSKTKLTTNHYISYMFCIFFI